MHHRRWNAVAPHARFMELIVDANVLFSALIRKGHTRHFLLFSGHSFYTPEFVFEEIEAHLDEIKEKTMLSESEIREILSDIFTFGNIKVIPLHELQSYRNEARKISPDPYDVHYVALALKRRCAIWSNDKDLKEKQNTIKVYNTEEIIKTK